MSACETIKNIFVNLFFILVLSVLLIIPSAICSVYKYFVYLYLKVQHGDALYSMMDGAETTWATQKKSLGQITTLFVHAYDEAANGPILDAFKRQIDDLPTLRRCCPKLFCRRRYRLGYFYFLKDYRLRLTKAMRSYANVDDLRRLLSQYASGDESFGEDDDRMMEVLVGTTAIDWHANDVTAAAGGKKFYPVIVRIHHSLGDGVSMNCLFIQSLMKNPEEFLRKTYNNMIGIRKTARLPREIRKSRNPLAYVLLALNFLARKRYAPPILRHYDEHILHGKVLSGDKILVWNNDARSEYVQKVKNVKNFLGNHASFNSVILAAISATFNEYFVKNARSGGIPRTITSSLVTLPQIPKFEELVSIDKDGTIVSIDMSNKYVVCALKLPMDMQTHEEINDASWKVADINSEIEQLKDSVDIPVLILCNRFIARLLPVPCVKLLMRSFNTTFGISNLPGIERGDLFHGGHLEDLYFWIPNSIKIGIGVSIFSSKGRLEMGLIVDKVLMPDVETAQRFLDRIMHHINQMDALCT